MVSTAYYLLIVLSIAFVTAGVTALVEIIRMICTLGGESNRKLGNVTFGCFIALLIEFTLVIILLIQLIGKLIGG